MKSVMFPLCDKLSAIPDPQNFVRLGWCDLVFVDRGVVVPKKKTFLTIVFQKIFYL